METRSANQTNAMRTVFNFCSIAANVLITNVITAFAGILTTVGNKLILIDNYDTIVTSTTKGVTIDTSAIRKVMESIAFKCSRAVIAFASQSPKNNTLIALVNYSKSKLKEAKKEDIAAICEKIRKAAHDNIAGAAAYGISASDVTDLAAAIALYSTSSSDPRQAKINKDDAANQIKKLIREVNQDLFKNQMDNMVLTLEATQPEFVGKYFKAREIIDLGKTHTKMKGSTKAKDGTILSGTIVEVMKTGETKVLYTIKSDNKGILPLTYILPGDYDFLVNHPGYKSITETNIHFSPGKTVTRNFILLPV